MSDANAKAAVEATLARPEMAAINFRTPSCHVESTRFSEVKDKVSADEIEVKHNTRMRGNVAKYRYTHDKMFLSFDRVVDRNGDPIADREALIVHESTHAVQDIIGNSMKMKDSEAAAYIAQCLFFYHRNAAALAGGSTPTFGRAILREAWPLAMRAKDGTVTFTTADLTALYDAIVADREYASQDGDDDIPYDGV